MIIKQGDSKGIKYYYRETFSDKKTFEEVIANDTYQKKGFKIQPDENWMDCGGNVGAVTLLACSKGANVTAYEPDPFNCEMLEKNLKLNGFKATIKQAALVHNDIKEIILFIFYILFFIKRIFYHVIKTNSHTNKYANNG